MLALLGIAVVAALLSNVVNNLPAVLVLLPLVGGMGPAAVLAVLIGVNVGPNLTYPGSLSNLLWRSVVRQDGLTAGFGEFSRVGAAHGAGDARRRGARAVGRDGGCSGCDAVNANGRSRALRLLAGERVG